MAVEVNPPPYRITADDKGGLLVVTAAVTMCYVWICFFIRIWLRLQTKEWKSDDWWLTTATFLQSLQSALVFHGASLGLGASLQGVPLSIHKQLGRTAFAAQILYVATLFASKCSVLFLYLRISPGRSHKISSWTLLSASCIWIVIAITLISVPCNPYGWTVGDKTCTNLWPKWQAISALDIVTEVFIFAIAVQLVWNLKMRTKSKLLVVLAFSARLPVIALATARLHYIKQAFVYADTTYIYLVATQWHMAYATMSSTITGMGPFLRPFHTEYMTSYKMSGYAQHGSSKDPSSSTQGSHLRSGKSWPLQSYQMNTIDQSHPDSNTQLSSVSHSPSSSRNANMAGPTFRPPNEMLIGGIEIWVGNRTSRDEEDLEAMSDETRLVITKRTELKVETDRASHVV
ncbi:hypothetical protein P153DRAFT_369507 [Dothidotthia symphoricarpi CBS 119687]|uniref:Rhodopsin domain-containing protein n=1 Tax=Dothidotthia symphoricarpi CBS 119687 TaxID=1392245 RepID=A0A6A6A6A4_9PLEO|nr:uncharacterized protein P153DRAFT_369507 [Dothidotthia symphoricarpi CBS 119687]KAF2126151.1 hypothetical protein P153DRAFT_369507 [Dothidotthia symphoricarpi CBS 119687]